MPNYLIVSALVTKIQLCSHYFLDHPRKIEIDQEKDKTCMFCWLHNGFPLTKEPPPEKTNNVVSEQV